MDPAPRNGNGVTVAREDAGRVLTHEDAMSRIPTGCKDDRADVKADDYLSDMEGAIANDIRIGSRRIGNGFKLLDCEVSAEREATSPEMLRKVVRVSATWEVIVDGDDLEANVAEVQDLIAKAAGPSP